MKTLIQRVIDYTKPTSHLESCVRNSECVTKENSEEPQDNWSVGQD
jgi:hypothetical protein